MTKRSSFFILPVLSGVFSCYTQQRLDVMACEPLTKNTRAPEITYDASEGISGELSEPITGDFWSEGPTSFYVNDTIYVYFDRYKDGKFGAVKSPDGGDSWTDISDRISLPADIRHGTVIKVPEKIIKGLRVTSSEATLFPS